MIRVSKTEVFSITATVLDTNGNQLSGKTLNYEVRYLDDSPLNPPITGTFVESTVVSGIYITDLSIPQPGSFLCYITCSGFNTIAKSVFVDPSPIPRQVWEHPKAQLLLDNISFIKAIESGNWKIVNNTMLFMSDDGSTEIATFELFDELGNLAEEEVRERRRIIAYCYNCILDETGEKILDESGLYLLDES